MINEGERMRDARKREAWEMIRLQEMRDRGCGGGGPVDPARANNFTVLQAYGSPHFQGPSPAPKNGFLGAGDVPTCPYN